MTFRRTIEEKCKQCGGINATLRGDTIYVNHNCPNDPPGPQRPPFAFKASEADFIRGDFTVEERRAQLDEANAKLERVSRLLSDQRRRLDDVFVAMRGYETNRIS